MKLHRSTVNRAIDQAITVISHFGIALPPWACWSPDQWKQVATDFAYNEIRDCMLGWDVTDFGSNDFENTGRVLFTLRNGKHAVDIYPKTYAEKLLIDPENQRAPAHFHRSKREDIIGLAGGNILVHLESASANDRRSGQPMTIKVDGIAREVPPAGIVRLEPGMSLTIPPRTIHQFWAEEGTGWLYEGKHWSLSREISSVCDDRNDNFFIDVPGIRFPEIVEDEPPRFALCHEYPTSLGPNNVS